MQLIKKKLLYGGENTVLLLTNKAHSDYAMLCFSEARYKIL